MQSENACPASRMFPLRALLQSLTSEYLGAGVDQVGEQAHVLLGETMGIALPVPIPFAAKVKSGLMTRDMQAS